MRVANEETTRQSHARLQSEFCGHVIHCARKKLRFERYEIRFCSVRIVLPGQAVAFGMQLEQYLGLFRPRGRNAI